jgi:dTDP-4-dehydrorhamnose 3,5-epimerase
MSKIIPTHLENCFIIENQQFLDKRGSFLETFRLKELHPFFKGSHPIDQTNVSFSKSKVFRGLHIQRDRPQGKLVTCLKGRILDIAVDLRPKSKTFKKWCGFHLSSPTTSIWLPPGFAHGFYSFKPSIVQYQCAGLWENELDGGVNIKDPDLNIPLPCKTPIISDKDLNLPTLEEWLKLNNIRD